MGYVAATDCPEEYFLIRASRYLRCHPSEVAGLPETRACVYWRDWALVCESAEAAAERESRPKS